MKRIAILTAMVFAVILPLGVQAYKSPGRPTGFVNDIAGILSSADKSALEEKLSNFQKETSNEIAIAIIKSLDGDTIENFAVKLFEEWGIGGEEKDNGVLVLVALDDRKMRIEVGYGLEGALTDAQSFWIINEVMRPAFQVNNFYGGLNEAIDNIIAATKGEYVPSEKSSSSDSLEPLFAIASFGGFFLIWLASILARSKSWWAGGVVGAVGALGVGFFLGFLYYGLLAFLVFVPLGLLFDFAVSRAYTHRGPSGRIPWWAGGSGFGHKSDHGGFGGFGGGSSGGGGASGGW